MSVNTSDTASSAAHKEAAAPKEKRLLPAHSVKIILGIFLAAVVLRLILGWMSAGQNGNIDAHTNPDLPYADLVEVAPGSPYFFTWGVTASPRAREIARTGTDNRYGDTYSQARQVLSQLQNDLSEVGLSLRDVVNVRAYIVGEEGEDPDFAGWNKAFTEFFGTWHNPHVPARTSVGITRLFNPDYRVEVEFVVAFPDDRGPFQDGSWFDERHARLSREETSERWLSYGRPSWVMSTGKATAPDTDLFFSAQVRPAPLMPNAPPALQMFGSLDQQTTSIFKEMSQTLKEAGLSYEDVFFVRTIVYPDPRTSIGKSFSSFNKAYGEFFNNDDNPNRPTRTLMSAPGLTGKKQYLSIEFYAAYPEAKEEGDIREPIGEAGGLGTQGVVGSRGTRVSKDGRMLWLSGTIASISPDESLEAQLPSALEAVEHRLELAGGSRENITAVRAYLVYNQNAIQMQKDLETWEKFFQENLGDIKPAVTTLPIVALPGGYKVELEVQAVVPEE
ncbi:MAG: Endoribonuclease L-PSP family [Puniceicoccaceae bacterium 5H]|nr:MAG: Endoribonuclease L-PSP family [Puniceicoccaceae bacterium 5H]